MPFEFMAKASRMVKIEKEQICGILKSTVPLFLLYPVCYEIQYFVLNDDVGASKTMTMVSSRNGYLPDCSWPPEEICWATEPVHGWSGNYWVRGF